MKCGNSSCWPVDAVMVGDICELINGTTTTVKMTPAPPSTQESTEATSPIIDTTKTYLLTTTVSPTTSVTTSGN